MHALGWTGILHKEGIDLKFYRDERSDCNVQAATPATCTILTPVHRVEPSGEDCEPATLLVDNPVHTQPADR
jgi:hypothetical protein